MDLDQRFSLLLYFSALKRKNVITLKYLIIFLLLLESLSLVYTMYFHITMPRLAPHIPLLK